MLSIYTYNHIMRRLACHSQNGGVDVAGRLAQLSLDIRDSSGALKILPMVINGSSLTSGGVAEQRGIRLSKERASWQRGAVEATCC